MQLVGDEMVDGCGRQTPWCRRGQSIVLSKCYPSTHSKQSTMNYPSTVSMPCTYHDLTYNKTMYLKLLHKSRDETVMHNETGSGSRCAEGCILYTS